MDKLAKVCVLDEHRLIRVLNQSACIETGLLEVSHGEGLAHHTKGDVVLDLLPSSAVVHIVRRQITANRMLPQTSLAERIG